MLIIFLGGPNNGMITDAYGIDGLPDRLDAEPKGSHQYVRVDRVDATVEGETFGYYLYEVQHN